jgi:hypothetical protein
MIVLIDHHGARLYQVLEGGALEEREHVKPKDPHGFERHLEHRKEADYQGQRVPEADEFYERVAEWLQQAPWIVLVGDATGKSSAMRYFVAYLEHRHKEIAQRVIAQEQADLSSLSLGDIEQLARRYVRS